METARVTTKGQLVVPARLRRKYGIKPGTTVRFLERDEEIVLQPLTSDFIRRACGMFKQFGPGTPTLLADRARDRKREDRLVRLRSR